MTTTILTAPKHSRSNTAVFLISRLPASLSDVEELPDRDVLVQRYACRLNSGRTLSLELGFCN